MIALFLLIALAIYFTISFFIVRAIYKYFGTKKSKYIAIAIMMLIPTWDVILGYPIYKLLCYTSAGVHIYKTVDNVEGFYVGEKSQRHKPHLPYDGYKYIDYKEMNYSKPTGKYYRSYWIDNNISEECIKPRYPDSPYDEYTKVFKSGKCVVEKEISGNEISRWEFDNDWTNKVMLYGIGLKLVSSARITDKKNKKIISELVRVIWQGGWIYGILSSIPVGNSWKIKFPTIRDLPGRTIIIKTLKLKEEK